MLTELEQRADVSVALNGHEVATLTTGLSSHSKQGRAVITPIFTVTYRGNDVVKVSGQLLFLCHLTLEIVSVLLNCPLNVYSTVPPFVGNVSV